LYISITNSTGGKIKKVGLEYISTKLGTNHGVGLKGYELWNSQAKYYNKEESAWKIQYSIQYITFENYISQ
jgi:hypothetical protein